MSQLDEGLEAVKAILEANPETRNSDVLLTWIYFKRVLGVQMPALTLAQLTSLEGKTETVRRLRAHIQNDLHEYPPTRPEVMKKRRQKEADFTEWFGQHRRGE